MMKTIFLLCVVGQTSAAVLPRQNLPANETSTVPFSLPGKEDALARATEINNARSNFLYGPDVMGPGGAYYPTGSLASEMIKFDMNDYYIQQMPWVTVCTDDATAAAISVTVKGGLTSLDAYARFYDGFKKAVPDGPYPGMLSNASSDLLFSMERLSTATFGIIRLEPSATAAFSISDDVARNISTLSQQQLLSAGRLFYVDHRDQEQEAVIDGRYAGATDAFFFIHPTTGDLLPLAVRLNRGSDLVYTPADTNADWTLAKMAFNMNDLWFQQWHHLMRAHYLSDLTFMAAVRALNDDHPVYGILDRLGYQTFAFRQAAKLNLINDGGPVDKYFFSSGGSAASYANNLYTSGAGNWLNTEFTTELRLRGLIDSANGPPLKHFPYFEDASIINHAINEFMTSYVDSYYHSDAAVAHDTELAAFIAEAIPAKIINFPTSVTTRHDLVALLRHFAMLVSVVHGVSNGNEPVKSTAVLPYHPMAFYAPLPTQKGLQDADLLAFMPNLTQSVGQIALLATFNRPWISANGTDANRTLMNMFNQESFLKRTNEQTRRANGAFVNKMERFSKVVQRRGFGPDGLSQGMPFVWKVLDPGNVPFSLTV